MNFHSTFHRLVPPRVLQLRSEQVVPFVRNISRSLLLLRSLVSLMMDPPPTWLVPRAVCQLTIVLSKGHCESLLDAFPLIWFVGSHWSDWCGEERLPCSQKGYCTSGKCHTWWWILSCIGWVGGWGGGNYLFLQLNVFLCHTPTQTSCAIYLSHSSPHSPLTLTSHTPLSLSPPTPLHTHTTRHSSTQTRQWWRSLS